MAKRVCSLFEDKEVLGQFRVEHTDEDGGLEVAIFSGPSAKDRAIHFAAVEGPTYYDGWSSEVDWDLPAPQQDTGGESGPTSFGSDSHFLVTWGAECGRRIRHKKRGTLYTIVAEGAQVQTDDPLRDYDKVAVYRGDDGSVWVRPMSEMIDGRFEDVPPPPAQEPRR